MSIARKSLVVMGLAAVAILLQAGWAWANFIAYNDCYDYTTDTPGWQLQTTDAKATRYGYSPNADKHGFTPGPGPLKDWSTGGSPVSATALVYANWTPGGGNGSKLDMGGDAGAMFNGKVDTKWGVIYSGTTGWYVELVFTKLNPSKRYTLATTLDRGLGTAGVPYTNRWTTIELRDADSSTYASSAGAYKVSDTMTSMNCYNTENGYVAQWTDINPGTDGDFTVRLTYATGSSQIPSGASQDGVKGYGPAAFMLQEVPEPATLGLLAVGGLLALRRRHR